jgi:AhpD family alkylhydroperoxidase
MRLAILDHGHGIGTKLLFGVIALASRQPVAAMLKLVKYRPDYFGGPLSELTHAAMRGPSSWSVGDRELMAAHIAAVNASRYCIGAHSAVASRAYGDPAKVAAVLADLETAPIAEPLRATLRMLGRLARDHRVDAGEMRLVLEAGATRQQIEDALAVSFAFNIINRLADAFRFDVPGPEGFAAGAKFLLSRGYRN